MSNHFLLGGYPNPDPYYISPEEEARLRDEHIESDKCWCHPTLEYVDPVTGREHWVHHKAN